MLKSLIFSFYGSLAVITNGKSWKSVKQSPPFFLTRCFKCRRTCVMQVEVVPSRRRWESPSQNLAVSEQAEPLVTKASEHEPIGS